MDNLVVVFAGEYDIASKEQLRSELDTLVPVRNLVLDLSKVTYLDSSVISELLRLHWLRVNIKGDPEAIVVRDGNVQKVFDTLGLRKVFRIVRSLNEAVVGSIGLEVRYAISGTASCPL